MIINIFSAKCLGIEAEQVTVEVDITKGIGVHLVGLADVAVKESLLRTMNALQSIGMHIPGKKIVINLAPADIHKQGSGYDLPIALGIIAASGQSALPDIDKYVVMGELGLDASLRPVRGALPIAEFAYKRGFKGCILPLESALEAVDYRKTKVYGASSLTEVLCILSGNEDSDSFLIWNREEYVRCNRTIGQSDNAISYDFMDFSEIVGQEGAKRGLEIAASGGHNVLMIGTPGSGKSSLAKALAGILPEMEDEEAFVTSKIYSISGLRLNGCGMIKRRPFRSPHYSASMAAMIGGGSSGNIMPGEVTLAHNGVLFCDEFAHIAGSVAEALRAPLEDRKVVVSRLKAKVEFPASFMFVAASNPCPCGYYGENRRCSCTVGQRHSYLAKLSGPIMDRIDVQLWLHPVEASKLVCQPIAETSAEIAKRVLRVRKIQTERFAKDGIFTNADMSGRLIKKYCYLSPECRDLMHNLIDNMGLSARAYSRVILLSRTIADMEGRVEIEPKHLMEAAGYRFLDKEELF